MAALNIDSKAKLEVLILALMDYQNARKFSLVEGALEAAKSLEDDAAMLYLSWDEMKAERERNGSN